MEINYNSGKEFYSIPKKYRIIENMHIVFWLIKDLACKCNRVWRKIDSKKKKNISG
jgi:hypothetical protein